jgi:hypothetical protein
MQTGQRVFLGDLQTLHFDLSDMNNLTSKIREGSEKATRQGWIEANQNSSQELGLYPKNDPMPLSSNLAKIA